MDLNSRTMRNGLSRFSYSYVAEKGFEIHEGPCSQKKQFGDLVLVEIVIFYLVPAHILYLLPCNYALCTLHEIDPNSSYRNGPWLAKANQIFVFLSTQWLLQVSQSKGKDYTLNVWGKRKRSLYLFFKILHVYEKICSLLVVGSHHMKMMS